jgi:hypothetical protein
MVGLRTKTEQKTVSWPLIIHLSWCTALLGAGSLWPLLACLHSSKILASLHKKGKRNPPTSCFLRLVGEPVTSTVQLPYQIIRSMMVLRLEHESRNWEVKGITILQLVELKRTRDISIGDVPSSYTNKNLYGFLYTKGALQIYWKFSPSMWQTSEQALDSRFC